MGERHGHLAVREEGESDAKERSAMLRKEMRACEDDSSKV